MKAITPKKLVVLAILLPVIVLAFVFLPSLVSPMTYDQARDRAGASFTRTLWDAKITTDVKDWEGRQYFDQGVDSFEKGENYKSGFTDRNANCISRAPAEYCRAAGNAFAAGYSFAARGEKEQVSKLRRVRQDMLKGTQENNWRDDIRDSGVPSYLARPGV